MNTRRDFFKSAAAFGLLGTVNLPLVGLAADKTSPTAVVTGGDDRAYWVSVVDKIARPVLTNLSQRTLRKNMPVECQPGDTEGRKTCTYLEAFGRLLCGIAPWLALENLTGDELKLQQELLKLAQASLDAATDPKSADYMNYFEGSQPLVDTAFLCQAILRAPNVLWKPLEPRAQQQIIAALKLSHKRPTPQGNNWVMFAATIEAALLEFGEPTLQKRLEDCVGKMINWYCGDGVYGDGPFFHFDYYNSFVIHPMLLTVLTVLAKHDAKFAPALKIELERAQRYAVIQERLFSPEGTFPSIGRSTAYRFGAFQTLSAIALMDELPPKVKPAQVRCALTSVIRKMIETPGTFDANGWLRIGFCGHQPDLGESYISTGSLYLCSVGLLPLGLPPANEFWSGAPERWTQQKLWSGEQMPLDHAMDDVRTVEIPTLLRDKA